MLVANTQSMLLSQMINAIHNAAFFVVCARTGALLFFPVCSWDSKRFRNCVGLLELLRSLAFSSKCLFVWFCRLGRTKSKPPHASSDRDVQLTETIWAYVCFHVYAAKNLLMLSLLRSQSGGQSQVFWNCLLGYPNLYHAGIVLCTLYLLLWYSNHTDRSAR